MAKNKHFEDTGTLYLPVPSGTVSGDPVCVGVLPGVAVTDRDSSGSATVDVSNSVYDLSVTGAVTGVGDPVFIEPATKALSVAPGEDLVVYGVGLATKGAGAGVIPVRVGYPSNATAAAGAGS